VLLLNYKIKSSAAANNDGNQSDVSGRCAHGARSIVAITAEEVIIFCATAAAISIAWIKKLFLTLWHEFERTLHLIEKWDAREREFSRAQWSSLCEFRIPTGIQMPIFAARGEARSSQCALRQQALCYTLTKSHALRNGPTGVFIGYSIIFIGFWE
jgi:hypothetical protein